MKSRRQPGQAQYLTGGNDALAGATQQNHFLATRPGRGETGLNFQGIADRLLSGADLSIMGSVFLALVFVYHAFHWRQIRKRRIDGLGGQPVFFGISARADTPDIQDGKPLKFNGPLNFIGQVIAISGNAGDIGRTGCAGDLADIQRVLQPV